MTSQHIYAEYRGHLVEITDCYWDAHHTALNVHIETLDGMEVFLQPGQVAGSHDRTNWLWVPLKCLHHIRLSDTQPVSDLIVSQMVGV